MSWTAPPQRHKITPLSSKVLIGKIFKSVAISGIIVYVIYILLPIHPCCYSSTIFNKYSYSTHGRSRRAEPDNLNRPAATNLSHVVFGITSSVKTWKSKKWYVESWWRPNTTRGYVFLDGPPGRGRWAASWPPYRVSEDTSRYRAYDKHPLKHAIRMSRAVVEAFREAAGKEGAPAPPRWFVLSDDDTVFLVENLVRVLGKYDHAGYFYVGMNSECHTSNWLFSFGMAFGGGGFALSYPLAAAVVKNMDICLQRYPTIYGSDHILQSCVADLGVSLTQEKGFHQIDLHSDISGFLSAHPQSPLVTLHHLDVVDPIFPTMDRYDGLNHLMKAAKADQSRLLQQSICYDRQKNWSFSVSWGYSVHLYEAILPQSLLRNPLQTFTPWSKSASPFFVFNTRIPSNNPCEAPHVFFFDSVENRDYGLLTRYTQKRKRGLPACSLTGSHSATHVPEIRVVSPLWELDWVGSGRECCEVMSTDERNATEIRISECLMDGIIL
ncbi:PREDICTED: uncharacterized protein LOC109156312 [Ipomoea nil]|uniref:uncharacterized protein LOC109156312 n=1 Tax=Ipomoea nil TaxID=35883 RepID=UPI0009011E4B|nr:PREDICTED: uncharacterized protein LOC109156312 [Ipomoea nil]